MINSSDIENSKAWPFVEARRIYEQIGKKVPSKGYVLFQTGYGPSGLPHIGTFAEIARTTMVRAAFSQICDIPTKLVCFSDDLDGLRKVPDNLPNKELVALNLNKPLTEVPDPFAKYESFGHHMNARLRSFLDRFGFDYHFYSASEHYGAGKFNKHLQKVLDNYDKIMAVMLPTLREERQKTYSPFMPICPDTRHVLQVKIEKISPENGTIFYQDNSGNLIEQSVMDGKCKLQWKPDFGMRWAALGVDYEMYGKDHMPNAKIYSRICEILGSRAPVQFFYELFLDADGAKISKSKGNSIGVEEWLKYAPRQSMELFMYQSPGKAKRLFFDVIPKNVDEYISFNQKYHTEEDLAKKLSNPVFHIHHGNVPKINVYGLNFSLLLNLAGVCNPDNKAVLWSFISQYEPNAEASNTPFLDELIGYAVSYYNDFVKDSKRYMSPTLAHKELLRQIIEVLVRSPKERPGEEIQSDIYAIGREAGYDNLRDYFKDLYQIILGQESGPRLGTFFKIYGLENSIELIKSKL